MKKLIREKCGVCKKSIYLHDTILVCTADGQSYHSKCLKIDRDTAYEIQRLTDWFCPLCLDSIFPFFNSNHDDAELQKCNSCSKFLSNHRNKVSQCIKCGKICQFRCLEQNLCKLCLKILNVLPKSQPCSKHIDPFIIEEDDECDYFFNDDIDNSNHTTEIAKNILMNCKYHNSD